MIPRSYIVIAGVLAGVVAAGLYATHMYAIFLFYWAFGAAAALLAFFGLVRIARAAQAPAWVGFALVSPFMVWAVERLRDMFASVAVFVSSSMYLNMAAALVLTAAAMGCVRLIEIVSAPSGLTRAAYIILALSILVPLFNIVQYLVGATWTRSATYQDIMSWVRWPLVIVKYGAVIAAPIVLVVRRKLEVWTLIPIVGLALFEAYPVFFPRQTMVVGSYSGLLFWLKPVAFFIGAAAVWRLGTLLGAQRAVEVRA